MNQKEILQKCIETQEKLMENQKEIIESREALIRIYEDYTNQLHEIIFKIDNALLRLN